MRVALVIYTYSENRGGAERACAHLARGLLERGHEVHVVAHRFGPIKEEIQRHEIPTNEIFSSWKHKSFAARSKKLLERERFDIVHSFTRTYYQDILRLGGGTHIEYLARTDGERSRFGRWWARINPKERAQLRLERLGFRPGAYRKIVAVSHRVKEEVIRHYGVPAADVAVIHNGVDARQFSPDHRGPHRGRVRELFGLHDTDLVYLFCGSGFKRKGLAYAIEAMALLPRDIPAKLVVVGEGNPVPYRNLARTLRIQDRVLLVGLRESVQEFYAAADIFILPTLYDPFPNACLEAMASGLPIITTRVTGVAEVIEHGVDSFIVDEATHVQEIAGHCRALAEKDFREKMGAAAREKAVSCSLDKTVAANLSIYEEILRSRTP